jgi:hypothetical protein
MAQHSIIVDGKIYQLFKRGNRTDSPWWTRVQAQGVRQSLSLNTADLTEAKKRAEGFVRSAIAGEWDKTKAMRVPLNRPLTKWATMGELLKNLPPIPSAPLYAKCALTLLTEGSGLTEDKAKALTLDHFTAPLVRAFQANRQGLKKVNPSKPTANNASANAVIKNARSLFSRKAIDHFDNIGLSVPDMSHLKDVPPLIEESRRYSDAPITDDTLRKLDALIPTQPKAIQQAHIAIRYHGTPPGRIPSPGSHGHARLLRRFGHTPTDLWHHAAACMLRRTGSFETVGEWCGLSAIQVKWHTEAFLAPILPLSQAETFLGVKA